MYVKYAYTLHRFRPIEKLGKLKTEITLKPSTDIYAHQRMKNAWTTNNYELHISQMYYEWPKFDTWNMRKLYSMAVWHRLKKVLKKILFRENVIKICFEHRQLIQVIVSVITSDITYISNITLS